MTKEPMYKVEAVEQYDDTPYAYTTYGPYPKKDADDMAEWLRYCGYLNVTITQMTERARRALKARLG